MFALQGIVEAVEIFDFDGPSEGLLLGVDDAAQGITRCFDGFEGCFGAKKDPSVVAAVHRICKEAPCRVQEKKQNAGVHKKPWTVAVRIRNEVEGKTNAVGWGNLFV